MSLPCLKLRIVSGVPPRDDRASCASHTTDPGPAPALIYGLWSLIMVTV